ncbi:FAD-binding dehydrogenase, partial [Campylobacter jejuni subsp. jejuni]
MEFDIVAIGGGNAALCAAIAAASKKENIKIALLESSPKEWRGGNSQHTRN